MTGTKKGLTLIGLIVAALALIAAGCGGDSGGGAPEALPSSSCTGIQFEGDGDPDYLIASDLPMQGSSRNQAVQITEAIELELKNREWKAGDYKIGFQVCDDATAQAGKWDSGKCSTNANAYAANDKLVGIIGTFNSGCAAIIIPVVNKAEGGAIPMISPANTWPCLTFNLADGCDASEPDKYYPGGTRNYLRVAPPDDYQGAAVAEYAKSQGAKKFYVLNDKEAYGLGVATAFRKAAEFVGLEVVAFEAYDPKASSYEATFKKVKESGADAIFVGGLICENGGQLIKDKVAVLGPNDGDVELYLPDGFTDQATVDDSGGAAAGSYMSVAGVPVTSYEGAAKEWQTQFTSAYITGDESLSPYAIYGAQAATVLLDAIAESDGSRSSILEKMFATQVADGLLGSFAFNENGDITEADGAVAGFTVYRASSTDFAAEAATISPSPEVVTAAGAK